MVDVVIFPIPNSVNFPGIPCPLHVFEPRYRQMVHHAVENNMPMGICHTEKVVHINNKKQTREEALNSNQSTYKPYEVFSAGPVHIAKTLDDGRILIEVDIRTRMRRVEEIQTLPFTIWRCEELPDIAIDEQQADELVQYKEKILTRLLHITHQQPEAQTMLKSEYWQLMSAEQFSFSVMALLGVDAGLKQHVLETTNPNERMSTILSILN